ncbi:hypothetical protein AAOE16_18050 [Ekhidna sp. MALMAid0563]|uniref:hypothetical protein n=1 Tax=Ekhidna sp. MALMAid0563 TaxID=3143937 RepID=UPI0032DE60AC
MENEEFDETTKRRAYSDAMKLRRSGLDNETIFARLEKQGIPEQLIMIVLGNMNVEQKKKVAKEINFNYKVAAFKVGAGIVAAIISGVLMPGNTIIPTGLILGGIILAIATNKQENENR